MYGTRVCVTHNNKHYSSSRFLRHLREASINTVPSSRNSYTVCAIPNSGAILYAQYPTRVRNQFARHTQPECCKQPYHNRCFSPKVIKVHYLCFKDRNIHSSMLFWRHIDSELNLSLYVAVPTHSGSPSILQVSYGALYQSRPVLRAMFADPKSAVAASCRVSLEVQTGNSARTLCSTKMRCRKFRVGRPMTA
jgi:hypothetical protein